MYRNSFNSFIKAVFFKNPSKVYPPVLGAAALLVYLCRAIVGGLLLCAMATWINPGMNWHIVNHSPLFYVIMGFFGAPFCHWLVWAFIILLPMSWLGILAPVVDWMENAFIFIVIAFFYILNAFTGYNPAESKYGPGWMNEE